MGPGVLPIGSSVATSPTTPVRAEAVFPGLGSEPTLINAHADADGE